MASRETPSVVACSVVFFLLCVVCQSELENRIICYSGVMQDTCYTSATDVNMLNTLIYNAKLSEIVVISCALGKSSVSTLLLCDSCNLLMCNNGGALKCGTG